MDLTKTVTPATAPAINPAPTAADDAEIFEARCKDLEDVGFRWTAYALRQAAADDELDGAIEVLHAGLFAQLESARANESERVGALAAACNILVDFADDRGLDADADFRACRICGCSQLDPCSPPCAWAERDLCDAPACLAAANTPPPAPHDECEICRRDEVHPSRGVLEDWKCSTCTRILDAIGELHRLGARSLAAALASAQGRREFCPALVEAISQAETPQRVEVLQRILTVHRAAFGDGRGIDVEALGAMAGEILRRPYAVLDALATRHHGPRLGLASGRILGELRKLGAGVMADEITSRDKLDEAAEWVGTMREGMAAGGTVELGGQVIDAARLDAIAACIAELVEVWSC